MKANIRPAYLGEQTWAFCLIIAGWYKHEHTVKSLFEGGLSLPLISHPSLRLRVQIKKKRKRSMKTGLCFNYQTLCVHVRLMKTRWLTQRAAPSHQPKLPAFSQLFFSSKVPGGLRLTLSFPPPQTSLELNVLLRAPHPLAHNPKKEINFEDVLTASWLRSLNAIGPVLLSKNRLGLFCWFFFRNAFLIFAFPAHLLLD